MRAPSMFFGSAGFRVKAGRTAETSLQRGGPAALAHTVEQAPPPGAGPPSGATT